MPYTDAPVSVIIPAHTEKRWDALMEAVKSVRNQSRPAVETIVVIDHNETLLERARADLPSARVLANTGRRGASGARNTGVAEALGEVVAFLDDDAVADEHWLELLCEPLTDQTVLGTGGGVQPIWPSSAPPWFPEEFGWVVGASFRGMPESPTPVRNVWGLNMAMRQSTFLASGGFRDGFGKLGERSRPEDTELCVRVKQENPTGHWLYVPAAVVGHRVPVERTSFSFFMSRCWHEGLGKAELAHLLGRTDATSREREYVLRTLPRGAGHGIKGALRDGDWWGLSRSAAIVGGLAVTTGGMLAGRLAVRREHRAGTDRTAGKASR